MYSAHHRRSSAPPSPRPGSKQNSFDEHSGHHCVIKEETLALIRQLTPRQRALLKRSFERLRSEAEMTGTKLFVNLFQEYPEYKGIFPKFRHLNDEFLLSTGELQNHGSTYMNGIREVIERLGDDDELAEEIRKIALTHKKKGVSRKHVMDMLPLFQHVVEMASKGHFDEDTKEAWAILFHFIADAVEQYKRLSNEAKSLSPTHQSSPAPPRSATLR